MAKIWNKSDKKVAPITERFTVGNDYHWDVQLAKYDVKASIAHAQMLKEIGLLTASELQQIVNCLTDFLDYSSAADFSIKKEDEDIHTTIEAYLISHLGTIGKKIHAGRSRNDQVLVAMQLFIKDIIVHFTEKIDTLSGVLLHLAAQYKSHIIPGYTHMQVAMPSSIGLWLAGFAEMMVDDLYTYKAAYEIADQNPLGSAAGYGSSFPIDRELTQRLLGFSDMKVNVIAAQMGRGRVEKSLGIALASSASTFSKLALDICLYMSQNFGFITFPDAYTTGSSIMPHKKNPDIFELVRGRCNRLQSIPNEITLLLSNLPSGYHREMQELKDIIFPAITTLTDCMDLLIEVLPHLQVPNNTTENPQYQLMYSVELVNKLVLEGKSFREAYQEVGREIESGKFQSTAITLHHTHLGSLGNLGLDLIQKKLKKALLFAQN